MATMTHYGAELAGYMATEIQTLSIMLQVRAQLVIERGEPTDSWPARAREMFVDEVHRRTTAAVAEARQELERPASPLAPESPPARAMPPQPEPPPESAGREVTFGTLVRRKPLAAPAAQPEPAPIEHLPAVITFDPFWNPTGWKHVRKRLEAYQAEGRRAIVHAPRINPMYVWEQLEEHGLLHLVDEVVTHKTLIAAAAAGKGEVA